VVALTGTDLYGDVPRGDPIALRSLELAHRLLVLQPDALRFLPKVHADKARVIPQSVTPLSTPPTPRRRSFDIAVVGHFRHVKDPMRTAMASRRLPPTSRIAVLHAGSILDAHFKDKIERETEMSSRYHWLGELSPARALRLIARSRGLVVSSRAEGGAHVVSEALVVETPILATAISGNIGMLGADYPGLFPVGDTKRLTELLIALETNTAFRDQLIERGRALAPTYSPLNERKCLAALIAGLDPAAS
jgi:glycosyltransferase involved in cell wall biosynthesis